LRDRSVLLAIDCGHPSLSKWLLTAALLCPIGSERKTLAEYARQATIQGDAAAHIPIKTHNKHLRDLHKQAGLLETAYKYKGLEVLVIVRSQYAGYEDGKALRNADITRRLRTKVWDGTQAQAFRWADTTTSGVCPANVDLIDRRSLELIAARYLRDNAAYHLSRRASAGGA